MQPSIIDDLLKLICGMGDVEMDGGKNVNDSLTKSKESRDLLYLS